MRKINVSVRKIIPISLIFICLVPFSRGGFVNGASDSMVVRMLRTYEGLSIEDEELLQAKWQSFSTKLIRETSKRKTDRAKIRYLHRALQGSAYFKRYEHNADFFELLKYGKFNCVTASVVYGIFFRALNIDFSVGEMPHHIYLVAHIDSGDYLLVDGTSEAAGLVFGYEAIKSRVEEYRRIFIHNDDAANFESENTISFNQFWGLVYYQEAVKNFNRGDFTEAIDLLEVGYSFYKSARISELILLSLASIIEDGKQDEFEIDALWKKHYRHYEHLQAASR